MRTSSYTRLAAVGLALAFVLTACGNTQTDNSSGGTSGGTKGSTPGGTAGAGTPAAFTISTDKCDNYQGTTGVSDTEIKIGSSFPQSGLYAPYAEISKGWKAYFDYINTEKGGVKGKKITVVDYDDAYDSGKTKENVQKLIETDKVFALFNIVGTPNNKAIRSDLNKACVPNLYAATGSQLWGETEKYPWVIGSIPSYATEAATFADYLKKNKPTAKVGLLSQNDDAGQGYVAAFKKAIEGTGITIVGEETYDAGNSDVTSQVTKLKNAGADTLLLATITTVCPGALKAVNDQSGWKPLMYLSATCTSNTIMGLAPKGSTDNLISSFYLKDPVDPKWKTDAGMVEFQTLGAKHGIDEKDLSNGLVGYGWAMGELLAKTLDKAPSLDRKAVMETAYSLQGLSPGLLLPGITVNTNGVADPFPIEQMQVGKYNGTYWVLEGDVISFEGKSKQFVQ